jgi:hypothetical protein
MRIWIQTVRVSSWRACIGYNPDYRSLFEVVNTPVDEFDTLAAGASDAAEVVALDNNSLEAAWGSTERDAGTCGTASDNEHIVSKLV